MSTYRCAKCNVQKNDTLNSQLNTSITCPVVEDPEEVSIHQWVKISEEDLVCS